MNGFYVGLPLIGSAYVEWRDVWLGRGIERREHDAEVWAGRLHITLSKPSRPPKQTFDVHPWVEREQRRERRLAHALANVVPAARRPFAALLAVSALTFAGGVTASTFSGQLTSFIGSAEGKAGAGCMSLESVVSESQWSHVTACNISTRATKAHMREVSGVTEDGHPVNFQATAGTKIAIVDRDILVSGDVGGLQRIRVPGVDQYEVEKVYQDTKGRLVLKGTLKDSSEPVRIRFERIEEIELDNVVLTLN